MPDPTPPADAPDRAPDEIQPPPHDTANSLGGGIDAAGLDATAPNPPGRSSDHDAEGWRAIPPATP